MDEWHRRRASVHRPHCYGSRALLRDRLALDCAQSLAWTAMVIQYSKCARLGQAIEQTLDGAHPCSLCHVVNKGTASEKKSAAQLPLSKIDIVCVARTFQLLSKWIPFDYLESNCSQMNSGILRPFRHRLRA